MEIEPLAAELRTLFATERGYNRTQRRRLNRAPATKVVVEFVLCPDCGVPELDGAALTELVADCASGRDFVDRLDARPDDGRHMPGCPTQTETRTQRAAALAANLGEPDKGNQ